MAATPKSTFAVGLGLGLATTFQLALRPRQGVVVSNGEAGRKNPGPARDQREAMVARVGPKVRNPLLIRGHQLKPYNVGREANGGRQVRDARAYVGDVLELDHRQPLLDGNCTQFCRAGASLNGHTGFQPGIDSSTDKVRGPAGGQRFA